VIDRNRNPLDPDEVAAFLDGRLEGEELERVQARFAEDAGARQELIKASRIVSTLPAKQRVRVGGLPLLAGLAAAAAIAFVVVQPSRQAISSVPVATERTVTEDVDRLELTYPADGATISGTAKSLSWHSVSGVSYRLLVSDAQGRTVLEQTTSDTSVTMPATLRKGATYFWSVDALAPDGSSLTSGLREFTVSER
jgi:hypothetical protein